MATIHICTRKSYIMHMCMYLTLDFPDFNYDVIRILYHSDIIFTTDPVKISEKISVKSTQGKIINLSNQNGVTNQPWLPSTSIYIHSSQNVANFFLPI
jgi:hypothetical protein